VPSDPSFSVEECGETARFGIMMIETAAERIAQHVHRTPVLVSPMLDTAADARVFVKAEALQLTGSFKIRGALNKIFSLDESARTNGVVAFSAGNHATAVAAAARIVGCPAVIIVPSNAARIKVDNCRWWGAEVVFHDPVTEDRAEVTTAIAAERGLTFISPFDDYEVMAGAGTVGLELAQDLLAQGVRPDAVVVNCSGGGLASGVLVAMEHYFPGIKKYIVEPRGYEKMARSLASGQTCANPAVRATVMDGINGPVAGKLPLSVLLRLGVASLSVTDVQALDAVAAAYRTLKIVVEPGGAASLAVVLSAAADFCHKTVAVVASGGNVDTAVYSRALGHPGPEGD
jgi:threonine dehydratase